MVKFVHMFDATLKSELCKLKPSTPDSQENSMMNHINTVNDERDFRHFVEQHCFQNYANNHNLSGEANSSNGMISGSNSVKYNAFESS
jgi:hypothetical protein